MSNLKQIVVPFTQVPNAVLNNPKLSWKAKGIYAYLLSKPDGWDFAAKRIKEDARDGIDGTIAGIKELEKYGLIKRVRQPNGRVDYHLRAKIQPHTENPYMENPKEGNSLSGKIHTVSNTRDKVIKTKQSKKEHSRKFLSEISKETIKEMTDAFKCEPANVKTYALKILDYCDAKGKTYKNYKAALRTWLRKDFGDRPPKKEKAYEIKIIDGKAVYVAKK